EAGRGEYLCPIQRAGDFLAGRLTNDVPANSYPRGAVAASIAELVPPAVLEGLRRGPPGVGRRGGGGGPPGGARGAGGGRGRARGGRGGAGGRRWRGCTRWGRGRGTPAASSARRWTGCGRRRR